MQVVLCVNEKRAFGERDTSGGQDETAHAYTSNHGFPAQTRNDWGLRKLVKYADIPGRNTLNVTLIISSFTRSTTNGQVPGYLGIAAERAGPRIIRAHYKPG